MMVILCSKSIALEASVVKMLLSNRAVPEAKLLQMRHQSTPHTHQLPHHSITHGQLLSNQNT
jgi:hypothetical protein